MLRRLAGFVCLAVVLTMSRSAAAQDVTFRFTGEVAELSGSPFEDIALGSVITGCYTFNTSTFDSNSAPTVGSYEHGAGPYGMVVQIGSNAFQTNRTAGGFYIEILNDHGSNVQDNYLIRSVNNLTAKGLLVGELGFQLDGVDTNAETSTDLTEDPPVLSLFQNTPQMVIAGPDWYWMVRGLIT